MGLSWSGPYSRSKIKIFVTHLIGFLFLHLLFLEALWDLYESSYKTKRINKKEKKKNKTQLSYIILNPN